MPSSTCPSSLLPGGTLALGGSWAWGGGPRTHPQRRSLSPLFVPGPSGLSSTWARGGGGAWGQSGRTPHLDLGSVTQLSPHWAGTFWDAPCVAMGEGARTGSCPFSPLVSQPPQPHQVPLRSGQPSCQGGVGRGIWGLRRRRGSGPSRGAGRVPAGRGRGALRLQPSPRGARRRLFRASWPALRAYRAHAGGRRRPIARARGPPRPDPAPAPRARSPATGEGLRSTSHLVFHCGDRGSVSRRPLPPRPAPAAAPTFLPSRSLTWPSTSAASVIFCHGPRAPPRLSPPPRGPPSPGSLSK